MKTQTIDKWILSSFKWYLGFVFCFVIYVLITQEDPVILPDSYCAPDPIDSSNFEAIIQEGPNGFTNLCETCHSTTSVDGFYLALLKEEIKKWEAYPKEDLRSFIRSSQSMISKDHPLADASWQKWKPASMPDFNYLTDKEIDDIITFVLENG